MSMQPVTTYFSGLAGVYNQSRPGYPLQAAEFIVADVPRPCTIADIGCGTGISTRLLAQVADRVIGVDPNDDMLKEARRMSERGDRGRIEYRSGTGERTGLDDHSANVVTCAQSFHWFDPSAALAEFHRILEPIGRLALMWNIRDDRDVFTAAYGQVVRQAQADARQRGLDVRNDHHADVTLGGYFDLAEKCRFANPQAFDLEGLLGRARSASYFPRSGPLRAELEDVLRLMFDRHQRARRIEMRQFTEVTIGRRIDRR